MKSEIILKRLESLRLGAREVRSLSSNRKNKVLRRAALLLQKRQNLVLKANREDLLKFRADRKASDSPAFEDRLLLNPKRISQMVESLEQVAALPDPVGEQVEGRVLKNGLKLRRERAPLGVIFMIFESRPNVAIESFSLGFKAGNAMILRGGRESMRTTAALYRILRDACRAEGVSDSCFWGIEDADRAIPQFLLKQSRWIDVVVPRGGEGLISYVVDHSKIPIIKNDRGLCHVYLHEDGDLKMAARIVVNAKTQRPGVCNAMETLLVHKKTAGKFLPELYQALLPSSVQWRVCPRSWKILKGLPGVEKAVEKSWDTEYLDLIMNCRVVDSMEEAMTHIETHGSRHSESIITCSPRAASTFQNEVDSAAVYWNASTRFTDGFEFGLGGELGISTQKLHVRGPVGLRELTSTRWIVEGKGQVRS